MEFLCVLFNILVFRCYAAVVENDTIN